MHESERTSAKPKWMYSGDLTAEDIAEIFDITIEQAGEVLAIDPKREFCGTRYPAPNGERLSGQEKWRRLRPSLQEHFARDLAHDCFRE